MFKSPIYKLHLESPKIRVFFLYTERQANKLMIVSVVRRATVYPKKYAHGFVVLCFVVVMQSLIMNSHEVFIHIPDDQGRFFWHWGNR